MAWTAAVDDDDGGDGDNNEGDDNDGDGDATVLPAIYGIQHTKNEI